jgi:hypothetical protein
MPTAAATSHSAGFSTFSSAGNSFCVTAAQSLKIFDRVDLGVDRRLRRIARHRR